MGISIITLLLILYFIGRLMSPGRIAEYKPKDNEQYRGFLEIPTRSNKVFKELISKDGHLKIELSDLREIQNGWEVCKAIITFKGQIILKDDLNYDIRELQLSHPNSEYYYIPVKGKPVLIRNSDSKIINLKGHHFSGPYFQGNTFSTEFLIHFFDHHILITHLKSLKTHKKNINKKDRIDSWELIDDQQLEIYTCKKKYKKKLISSFTIDLSAYANPQ